MFKKELNEIDNLIFNKNYKKALEVIAQVLDKNKEEDATNLEVFLEKLEKITKVESLADSLLTELDNIRLKLSLIDFNNSDVFPEFYKAYTEAINNIKLQQQSITNEKHILESTALPDDQDFDDEDQDFDDEDQDDGLSHYDRVLYGMTPANKNIQADIKKRKSHSNRGDSDATFSLASQSVENTMNEKDALKKLVDCRKLLKNSYVDHTFAHIYLTKIYQKFPDQIIMTFISHPEVLFQRSLFSVGFEKKILLDYGTFLTGAFPDEKKSIAHVMREVNGEPVVDKKKVILNAWKNIDSSNKNNQRMGISLSGNTALKGTLTKTLKEKNFSLGIAVNTEDCLFDVFAQAYNARIGNVQHTTKTLRELCHLYIAEPSEENAWVKAALNYNDEEYQQYQVRLPLIVDEMKGLQNLLTGSAVLGKLLIEGRILCKMLGINVVVFDTTLAIDKSGDKLAPWLLTHELGSDRPLDLNAATRLLEDENSICIAAGHNNHFVPVLSNKQGSLALKC